PLGTAVHLRDVLRTRGDATTARAPLAGPTIAAVADRRLHRARPDGVPRWRPRHGHASGRTRGRTVDPARQHHPHPGRLDPDRPRRRRARPAIRSRRPRRHLGRRTGPSRGERGARARAHPCRRRASRTSTRPPAPLAHHDLRGRLVMRVRVAVVGAGFAGIAMARRLDAAGESFVVLERRPGIGGTWYDNRYPGVACDVPAHLYGFSDIPHPGFSRVFAPGAEIREYLEDAAASVADRIMLSTRLEEAVWNGSRWNLATSRGDVVAEVLVLAAGRLTEPRYPEVDGEFAGPVVHTARWDDDLELEGARVAVVGTGASGLQVIPEIARVAESVVVLQRSAPYVLPKGDRAYDDAEISLFRSRPERLDALRESLRRETDEVFDERAGDARLAARDRALAHLAERVPDPVLRAALTPD